MIERDPSAKPSPEDVHLYNATDWPGSSSFHPSHLSNFAQHLLDGMKESKEAHEPEIPEDQESSDSVE